MNKKEFKEIFDYLDKRLIICDAVKEPINKDLDCAVKLSVAYEEEIQKNQQLEEQLKLYETYLNRFFKVNNKSYDGKVILNLLEQRDKVINKAIEELGRYADEMAYSHNGNAYAICVNLLDTLKKYKGDNNE